MKRKGPPPPTPPHRSLALAGGGERRGLRRPGRAGARGSAISLASSLGNHSEHLDFRFPCRWDMQRPMTELVAPRLSAAATRLPRLAAGPKALAVLCVVALTGLGWAYLGLMIAVRAEHAGALAPGRGLLDLLTFPGLDALGRVVLDVVCRSALDAESHLPAAGAGSAADLALVALMWCAMVLAMMLPTAGPMILTYAEV